ncbi:hypothetical protein ZWY2020_030142 [Hordeum vulgare]|nr:hypothetical protein ZWY2020_030142 [Hordeum vulgare]
MGGKERLDGVELRTEDEAPAAAAEGTLAGRRKRKKAQVASQVAPAVFLSGTWTTLKQSLSQFEKLKDLASQTD